MRIQKGGFMGTRTIKKYSFFTKLLYKLFRPALYKKIKAEEAEMVDDIIDALPGDEEDASI